MSCFYLLKAHVVAVTSTVVSFKLSRAYELELRMYDGDDPLDVWDR